MLKVSVVIPTLNAGRYIERLLSTIHEQSVNPDEVLVIDSSSDDDTLAICRTFDNVSTHVIKREDFDHGETRHLATQLTSGDFILFLTQDAIPVNNDYVKNLLTPMLNDDKIAMASGRQVPKPDARRSVQLVQEFNYPCKSHVRTASDIEKMGIKAFFVSDACSAYRRSAYVECGGFARPLNMSEDMLMAATFLQNGWKVAYVATAQVYHSHNLTLRQQYARNKLIGAFLESHRQELCEVKESSEGRRLVKRVSAQLLREGRPVEWVRFVFDCAGRFLGNRVGKLIK